MATGLTTGKRTTRRDDADIERDVGRILRRVAVDGDCWIWTGATKENGYGVFTRSGRRGSSYVHRFMAEAAGYDIAEKYVCHHCDRPPCCNPAHLFVGTPQDNVRDCILKGRFVAPPTRDWRPIVQSGNHHWQKLRQPEVVDIKRRLAEGETLTAIAADYGVSFQQISKIKNGTRWAHV